jgi:uncharacterized membrane protein
METQNISQDDKLFGALSYVWVVSIIMFILKKGNPFIGFHSRQGMVLFIASLVWFVPVIGWIVAVVALVLMVIGFEKAYHGEKYRIPFVADLAEKIK